MDINGIDNYSILEKETVATETIPNNTTINKSINIKTKIQDIVKRIIDIIGGLVGTILLAPITLCVYIARIILKENDGPMFYEQLRIGKNGKVFRIYKYRSMVINADKKLEKYLEENEEAKKEFEENQKLENDPRITRLGNFLRKTSIDEFPQFVNILKGDMSLVGPRPVVDGEIEKYGKYKDKFLSVKPGLTGYWQVNGRSNTTYDERIEMELYYVDNKSLLLDIKILFKTFTSVIKKEGAM